MSYTKISGNRTVPVLPLGGFSYPTTPYTQQIAVGNSTTTIEVILEAKYKCIIDRLTFSGDGTYSGNFYSGVYISPTQQSIDSSTGIPVSFSQSYVNDFSSYVWTLGTQVTLNKNDNYYVYIVVNSNVTDDVDVRFGYSTLLSSATFTSAEKTYTINVDIYVDGTAYHPTMDEWWAAVYEDQLGYTDPVQTLSCAVGQLIAISGSYRGNANFKGWWSSPNGTGTCYSMLPRTVLEVTGNATMYAVYSTTAATFDWDTPKVSGGDFNVTAIEFNKMIGRVKSHATSNTMTGGYATPYELSDYTYISSNTNSMLAVSDLIVTAANIQNAIDIVDHDNYATVVATYGVQKGNTILASLFQWFKDTVNNNYF